MRRFILTGAPGAGKTTILRALQDLGYPIVDEAATAVIDQKQAEGIARPWEQAEFIDAIMNLQWQRLNASLDSGRPVEFHDRSIIDTYVLALHLGFPLSRAAEGLVDRVIRDGVYQKQVFFVDDLGFIVKTAARQISYEEALKFGALHKQIYGELGFDCIPIPAQAAYDRAQLIITQI